MKINEILAEVKLTGKTLPGQGGSMLGSFLRGAGMTQGADASDAHATAQQLNPQAKKSRVPKTQPAVNTAAADAKRARFIAVIKQQADRQGSISKTEIGKRIPKQGEYADPARRREAVRNIAQELQQQGVIVTDAPATASAPATNEPYSIGGQRLDPTKPGDKAIIDKLKAARA